MSDEGRKFYDLNGEWNHNYLCDVSQFDVTDIYIGDKLVGKSSKYFDLHDYIIYNGEKYIVIELSSYRDKNDKVYLEKLEDQEKKRIIINKMKIEYESLKYLEDELIRVYGYRLQKIEEEDK